MKISFILVGSMLCAVSGFSEAEKLTLDQALNLARIYSPELRAARLNTQAAEQAVAASGRRKNPEFDIEAEGIGGDRGGTAEAEYTLALKQQFQRGGKRKKDRAVAEKSIGVAFQYEAEKARILLAEVRLVFIEVLAQQETGKVRVEQEQLARAFVEVAKRRHEAGGGSELDVMQAELTLEETLLLQTCCFGDLKAARVHLASLIGQSESGMAELEGAYFALPNVDDSMISDQHPALQRAQAEIEVARAVAARAQAQDAADITLGAGYRYEAGADINTFVLGASIPLNFVRAGRAEQVAKLMQADAMQAQSEELRRAMQQQLSVLTARYSGAKLEAEMMRDRLMPKAEKAYQLSREGYDAGRFSWIELIAAQHHLAEIRIRHIEALKAAHLTLTERTQFINEGI